MAKNKTIVSSAYIGCNMAKVGGYSGYEPPDTRVMADFVDNDKVVKIAKKSGIKWVHLAGDWKRCGKKGYGQRVSISEANKLVKKLKKVV